MSVWLRKISEMITNRRVLVTFVDVLYTVSDSLVTDD